MKKKLIILSVLSIIGISAFGTAEEQIEVFKCYSNVPIDVDDPKREKIIDYLNIKVGKPVMAVEETFEDRIVVSRYNVLREHAENMSKNTARRKFGWKYQGELSHCEVVEVPKSWEKDIDWSIPRTYRVVK